MNPLEAVVPARLGSPFRWLLGSVVVANLGDGIALAAGPLLVASETHDPLLVAAAAFLQQLPWLLFGIVAGAYVDRLDRRLMVAVVDTLRALVLLALTATIVTGRVDIAVVLLAMFLLGTAETFSDIASQTLIVGAVEKRDLGIANARVQGAFILTNQLGGPPIGALLFAAARPWPFVTTAVCYLLGAVLVARVALRPRPQPERRPVREEVSEGVRWLRGHPPLRTLAVTIVLFNVTFGAAWSVMVLYATDRLGLSEAGFGWLTTTAAAGGLIGTASYGWLERNVPLATLMRVALTLETFLHLTLALSRSALVAFVTMFVFGLYAFVWGTASRVVRQRAVPDELQGRVGSVYLIGSVTGMLVGTPIGGVLARVGGLAAPFWFGFVGSGVLVVLLWRQLALIAHEGEAQDAPVTSAPEVP